MISTSGKYFAAIWENFIIKMAPIAKFGAMMQPMPFSFVNESSFAKSSFVKPVVPYYRADAMIKCHFRSGTCPLPDVVKSINTSASTEEKHSFISEKTGASIL